MNTPSHCRRTAEAKSGASAGFGGFDFAVTRWRVSDKRVEQFGRDPGYFINRVIEDWFVGLRRLVEAAKLSHKLNCGRANLVFSGRWFEVVQGFDIATHNFSVLA
jgi:hypothetical protein